LLDEASMQAVACPTACEQVQADGHDSVRLVLRCNPQDAAAP
jgi:hypothetical protein